MKDKSNQSQPAKIISKPINQSKKKSTNQSKDDIIELKDEIKKPLIDLSNGPVTIETQEVVESIEPDSNWSIGDPIKDKSIFELAIGNDWKLVRHNKKINQWKFVSRQSIKGVPKWIDDSEFISYKEASELIIDGYCE